MPTEDRYLMTREELEDTLASILGGRAAEEIVFSEISTGASNDLQQATNMAERMVKEYGMSERLGLVAHREDRGQQQFLGGNGSDRAFSEETARAIDEEVGRIIRQGYQRAKPFSNSSEILWRRSSRYSSKRSWTVMNSGKCSAKRA